MAYQILKLSLSFCFVWKEFLGGAIAGSCGEGMMHQVGTVKTHIQSKLFFVQVSAFDVIKTRLQVQGSTLRYNGCYMQSSIRMADDAQEVAQR
ncbi:hypothetical protein L3X38_040068 [Prunus dulcis]|uniref:Mitochondrial substrate carrier family protein n=1 Tax=Prunus dulcis TaxID=3755 RepID=A0AAD4V898_PRUDU|nr:hypothetical protein L3X38_040068 [Prunus dulcis]